MPDTKTKNKNFRIDKNGNIELCMGIEDMHGNLIYENDILKSEWGNKIKIIYSKKKEKNRLRFYTLWRRNTGER